MKFSTIISAMVFAFINLLFFISITLLYGFNTIDVKKEYIQPLLLEQNISYGRLSLFPLNRLTVSHLDVMGAVAVESIVLKLQYRDLLMGCIRVKSLDVEGIKIANLEVFDSADANESSDESSEISIPICIKADTIHLSLQSFMYDTIDIKPSTFQARKLAMGPLGIQLKEADLNISKIITPEANVSRAQARLESLGYLFGTWQLAQFTLATNQVVAAGETVDAIKLRTLKAEYGESVADVNTLQLQALYQNIPLNIEGQIKRNRLFLSSLLNPELAKAYMPEIINQACLKPIEVDVKADEREVHAIAKTTSCNLFKGDLSEHNLSIASLRTNTTYNIKKQHISTDVTGRLHSRYGMLNLKGDATYENRLIYNAQLSSDEFNISAFEPSLNEAFFKEFALRVKGSDEEMLFDLKHDFLNLEGKMRQYNATDVNLSIDKLPLSHLLTDHNGSEFVTLTTGATMLLDPVFKMDGSYTVNFNDQLYVDASVEKKRLFLTKGNVKAANSFDTLPIKKRAIFPFTYKATYSDAHATLEASSRQLQLDVTSDFSELLATLYVGNQPLKISGKVTEPMDIHTTLKVKSLAELEEKLSKLIEVEPLPLNGDITLTATVSGMYDKPKFGMQLQGKELIYKDKANVSVVDYVDINATMLHKKVRIDNYYINFEQRIFHATSPSIIEFTDDEVTVEKFYLNNADVLNGVYNTKEGNGTFVSRVKDFAYKGPEGELLLDTDIIVEIEPEKIDIEGEVLLKEGNISYMPASSDVSLDKDIIVVHKEVNQTGSTPLSMNINVRSLNPLTYKLPDANIRFMTDLNITKQAVGSTVLFGSIYITNGYYDGFGKTFNIRKSDVRFSGGKEVNPYLNINVDTKTKGYFIVISIRGTMLEPDIYFRSDPPLSQSDILSLVMFDSKATENVAGSGDGSSAVALGGVFGNELSNLIGIRVNKLNIIKTDSGATGAEIGTRVSSKVTISYIAADGQAVGITYQLTDDIGIETQFGTEGSSADIIYQFRY